MQPYGINALGDLGGGIGILAVYFSFRLFVSVRSSFGWLVFAWASHSSDR